MLKTLTTSKEGKIQRLNCIKITLKIPGESQLAFFWSSKQTNKGNSSYCFSALLKIAKIFPRDAIILGSHTCTWDSYKHSNYNSNPLDGVWGPRQSWISTWTGWKWQVRSRKLNLVTNQFVTRAPTLPRPHMTRVSSRVTIYSVRAVKSSEGIKNIKIAVVWP